MDQRAYEKNNDNHSRFGYLLVLGIIFIVVGFGLVIAISTQNASFIAAQDVYIIFVGSMVMAVSGLVILLIYIISYGYSTMSASRRRVKGGKIMTVYDAMSLRVYYPSWMKWWIPLIPMGIFLLLGAARIIPPTLASLLFFAYAGLMILYQYLYARRWLAKYQKRS